MQPVRVQHEFEKFVERVETRLISYLRFSLRDHTEAEDLFQETLLRAHGEWDRLAEMDRPDAWLFRVARNLMINRSKRRQTERRALNEKVHESAVNNASPAERNELRRAVQAALNDLPQDQREAVSLKVWGECTWVEIGVTLGVSEDTASRLFSRGLKAIAPHLKDLKP
ncbi:MAG: sigma-70 family RNA polymerase sigma factor [Planctomycetes bacterium]|nr:sigma-70 family RNA polymerase sigma factor [Planctomycetota bacterium]